MEGSKHKAFTEGSKQKAFTVLLSCYLCET